MTDRPLVVTDCDEVLLHMVRHFAAWLDDAHAIDFSLNGDPFVQSMTRRGEDGAVKEEEVWALLGGFFDTQMATQEPIHGAVEAIAALSRRADVVVLTNLADSRREDRAQQLRAVGIDVPVYTNQGPKGRALAAILDEHGAAAGARRAIFIDDLAGHHTSAARHASAALRLQFCGEASVAPHIPCAREAGHAHARIDSWDRALPWIEKQLFGDVQ